MNFIVTTPQLLFIDFLHTAGNRQTADYLVSKIFKIIDKYHSSKFSAFICNNGSNN